MKTKEKKIKAWLDFIQADLDTLRLDKKVSVLFGVFEDMVLTRPFIPMDGIASLQKWQEALGVDESNWENFMTQMMLRDIQDPKIWSLYVGLQTETRKYLEKLLTGSSRPDELATSVVEYLVEMPSGVFRKGFIPETFERTGISVLSDLLDGVPKSVFKRCPECNRWFFHLSKREKEFCTNRCASRHLTRKKRTESEEAKKEYRKKMREIMKRRRERNNTSKQSELQRFMCPGNFEEMSLADCKGKRGKFYVCKTCKWGNREISKKEGKDHGGI